MKQYLRKLPFYVGQKITGLIPAWERTKPKFRNRVRYFNVIHEVVGFLITVHDSIIVRKALCKLIVSHIFFLPFLFLTSFVICGKSGVLKHKKIRKKEKIQHITFGTEPCKAGEASKKKEKRTEKNG